MGGFACVKDVDCANDEDGLAHTGGTFARLRMMIQIQAGCREGGECWSQTAALG